MFYVYEWFIEETGEIIYVGKGTRGRYKVRKHNRHFNDMIKRYKCSSRIIKEFEKEDDAFRYEDERIIELKSKGQCVCNIKRGGNGGSIEWWTDEVRQKYSEHNVMKSEMQRKRMSINNPMKDKETALRVAVHNRRKICVNNMVYASLQYVADLYNVSPQLFMYWLQRGYTNDLKQCYYFGEEPKELKILDHSCSKESKPVMIDGIVYKSIKSASEAIGCNNSYLSKALRKNKPVKGHICKYVD